MLTDNLKAFLAVADSRSFSQAGETLHLSQPAISKRIAALETELGQRLFDRIGRQVSLTEAGRVLLPQARRIIEVLNETRRLLDNLSDQVQGPLILATSHHIGLRRLPPVLREFARRHPAVALDIRFMESEEGCRAAEQGLVDIAVVTLPQPVPATLRYQRIWNDPLRPMVARDHVLAGSGHASTGLAEHAAVLPPTGTFTRQIIDQALLDSGIRPPRILEATFMETIHMMVGIGLGWGMLPLSMQHELHILPAPALHVERDLGWVTHRERSLSNATRALLNMLDAQRQNGPETSA